MSGSNSDDFSIETKEDEETLDSRLFSGAGDRITPFFKGKVTSLVGFIGAKTGIPLSQYRCDLHGDLLWYIIEDISSQESRIIRTIQRVNELAFNIESMKDKLLKDAWIGNMKNPINDAPFVPLVDTWTPGPKTLDPYGLTESYLVRPYMGETVKILDSTHTKNPIPQLEGIFAAMGFKFLDPPLDHFVIDEKKKFRLQSFIQLQEDS